MTPREEIDGHIHAQDALASDMDLLAKNNLGLNVHQFQCEAASLNNRLLILVSQQLSWIQQRMLDERKSS